MKTLEKLSEKLTNWIGTPVSIITHTLLFIGIFGLRLFNYSIDEILLILTTVVSLEAIYLAIFIQMTVNKTTISLQGVEEDIDEIQEDVDEIQEDVEDIELDVKEISEDYIEENQDDDQIIKTIKDIEKRLVKLHNDVVKINKKNNNKTLK